MDPYKQFWEDLYEIINIDDIPYYFDKDLGYVPIEKPSKLPMIANANESNGPKFYSSQNQEIIDPNLLCNIQSTSNGNVWKMQNFEEGNSKQKTVKNEFKQNDICQQMEPLSIQKNIGSKTEFSLSNMKSVCPTLNNNDQDFSHINFRNLTQRLPIHIEFYTTLVKCISPFHVAKWRSSKCVSVYLQQLLCRFKQGNWDYDYLRWLIRNICITLGVYESDLNIIEKPKGGMMGDLLYFYDDSVYNLNDYNSIQPIPEKVSLVEFVETKADFILVVESYVVFRELVFNNNIRKRFNLIILVTDGYPSKKTQSFLQKLLFDLQLPVFVLVNSNPYGIRIVSNLRYGSKTNKYENFYLNVPYLKWIGINADDIKHFNLSGEKYNKLELEKFDLFLKEEHIINEPEWYDQVTKMKELNVNVELEHLIVDYPGFLVNHYLPYKLANGNWY
ncbi:hypothetical protein RDWZM_010512 [Blomia tropicalis]|uniref:Topoisomerase 6 subunit A/Spo11 TOPRIM domain-containing protein n=1 Tax=Blomia tropicalis TaxID=40697 RepID=A0A9Q0M160_BLOTA|nr:hypothetical protein RDWZM_010512 [Blomia tropicalis]